MPVPRNYTLTTIKTLFGEASTCAYPDCPERLIFNDRGVATTVAEIAHIRSESPDGPRHDPKYTGDINGPANLLLLCGKHHRPVDRHEALYEIAELEGWKAAQTASAGGGTPLTDSEARSYARLSAEERSIIMQLARLAERLSRASRAAHTAMNAVREEAEETRLRRAYRHGRAIYELQEDGTRKLINDQIQLSHHEQQDWAARAAAARDEELPSARQAARDLAEEVAILRMISPSLGAYAKDAKDVADEVVPTVGDDEDLANVLGRLEAVVTTLWRVANGDEDP